jgi:phage shock protein E
VKLPHFRINMLVSRRIFSIAFMGTSTLVKPISAFVPLGQHQQQRTLVSRSLPILLAAPGVVLSPLQDIKGALENPATIVLDARGLDEIAQSGYLETDRQWVHAPCTLAGCPLLEVAANGLLPDKEAPVIVYCASGKRSTVAKEFLEKQGYKNVLNAGGFPGDTAALE